MSRRNWQRVHEHKMLARSRELNRTPTQIAADRAEYLARIIEDLSEKERKKAWFRALSDARKQGRSREAELAAIEEHMQRGKVEVIKPAKAPRKRPYFASIGDALDYYEADKWFDRPADEEGQRP